MTEEIRARAAQIQEGKVPEGYQRTPAGVIPLDWNAVKLGDVVKKIEETAGNREYETLSISAGVGFVNQAKKFGRELSGAQYSRYTVLHRDDFSYNKGNSSLYPQGCIYRLKDRETAAVPNVFESFRFESLNGEYYDQLFTAGYLNRQLFPKINHGVRDNDLLNLTGQDFYSCYIPIPPLAEQQKIAEVLVQCDALMKHKRDKIAEIKNLKMACLDKMFPGKGSNVPEIRFPGFTDDWEQRKLGELAQVCDSARIPNAEWSGTGIPYIRASDLTNDDLTGVLFLKEDIYKKYDTKTGSPSMGDVLFNGGGEIGKSVLKRDDKPIYVQGGAVLYVKTSESNVLSGEYLNAFFSSPQAKEYIDLTSAGGTMKHFTLGPSNAMPITYPSMNEQVRIGKYFRHLDHLIALHQRELEETQNYKKALMQLLLTGLVRVGQ